MYSFQRKTPNESSLYLTVRNHLNITEKISKAKFKKKNYILMPMHIIKGEKVKFTDLSTSHSTNKSIRNRRYIFQRKMHDYVTQPTWAFPDFGIIPRAFF